MNETDFSIRLSALREKKGVSARDMSLSIGQNAGYINNIETGKSMPSLTGFFYICEYLNITPDEFFDISSPNPQKIKDIIHDLKQLDDQQLDCIAALIKYMIHC